MKVVVTGGAGFIGTALVHTLLDEKCDVFVVDNFSTGSRENIHPRATYYEYDITDGHEKMIEFFSDATVVFHLAASISVPYSIENPEETSFTNVLGTVNVLRAAKESNAGRVLFISSAAVYGEQPISVVEDAPCEPLSPYGLEKMIGEEYCKLFSRIYNLSTVTARLFNIYGPRQTSKDGALIPILLQKEKNGEPAMIYGSGEQLRDFIFVEDAVEAFLKLALSGKDFVGDVFNVGSGVGTSVMDVARLITNNIEQVPERLEIKDSVACVDKIQNQLSWSARTSIETGIEKTKEAYGI